jgi:hypothetical protein
MDLTTLDNTPPWEWPEGTDKFLVTILRDTKADPGERLLAADMAGEYSVINDDLASALLAIACQATEEERLRCEAVLSLGLALEHCEMMGFEDEEDEEEQLISEALFEKIQENLHKLFMDTATPEEVRRRTLEASAHAPQQWHTEAVRAAYASSKPDWRLTAVFCMRTVGGFEPQIIESLRSGNPDLHFQAVCAAGQWGVEAAWEHVVGLVKAKNTDKPLLLAAIEAVAAIRPQEALRILDELMASDDEEISDAVQEALLSSGAMMDLEADSYDDDDFTDEDPRDK